MSEPIEKVSLPLGLSDGQVAWLKGELDPKRIRKKPGKNLDYLATHDVIRTANRIFGFGQWGYEVVTLEMVGQHQVTNARDEQGWYVGYRCIVKLTVVGCVPVSGVGYGDAFEKQWSAVVSSHELAVKEAESDALKRALRNFGDQFGLILYAKDDEKARIESERPKQLPDDDRSSTDEEVSAFKKMARDVSHDAGDKADKAVQAHRAKMEEAGFGPIVSAKWLTNATAALVKSVGGSPFKPPAGVQTEPPIEDPGPEAVDAAFRAAA